MGLGYRGDAGDRALMSLIHPFRLEVNLSFDSRHRWVIMVFEATCRFRTLILPAAYLLTVAFGRATPVVGLDDW